MTRLAHSLALAAIVAAGGASLASADTLGDRLNSGSLSKAAFEQLIAHTGLSADEASARTLNEIYRLRATND